MTRRFKSDRQGLSFLYQIIILVIAVVVAMAVFYGLYVQRPPVGTTPRTAQPGDTATISYIGTFKDTGKVFDTSSASVAKDNVSYPKAVSFTWRASWQPFSFKIGAGQAIKGFDDGVVGMAVGDSKRVIVPPQLGYGLLNPSLVVERQLLQPVPVQVITNDSAFSEKYGTRPVNGLIVIDPFWGWNASVVVTTNIVTVINSPQIGERLRPQFSAAGDEAGNVATGMRE
jgi:hypothetical protein